MRTFTEGGVKLHPRVAFNIKIYSYEIESYEGDSLSYFLRNRICSQLSDKVLER